MGDEEGEEADPLDAHAQNGAGAPAGAQQPQEAVGDEDERGAADWDDAADQEAWNKWGYGWNKGWAGGAGRGSGDHKGHLPKVPFFDGDKTKDSKCYRTYKRKVENWVEIAKEIIGEAQVGPRLYYEITGKAFEYLEGTTAQQFAGDDGWKVLLKILDHFDERPIVKMGTAMDQFFNAETLKDN